MQPFIDVEELKLLSKESPLEEIITFAEIDSTNLYAMRNLVNFKGNTLLVAAQQTNGQGRFNRKYYSDQGGLYFSLVLKQTTQVINSDLVALITAVAVVKTFENLYQIDLGIKWVNDIFYKQKKVGGVLIQTSYQKQEVTDLVVGIGLNLSYPEQGFVKEINDIAGVLFEECEIPINKEEIIASIVSEFFKYYEHKGDVLTIYSEHSIVLNRNVELMINHEKKQAYVKRILADGALEVIVDEQIVIFNSGEVRLKL